MTQKDKRSNRRRVSCGFHHKRHQACPDNCEGRVSHPPDVHEPVQDKFTVGCTECKSFFQEKLFSQTTLSGKPISQIITNNNNNNTTSPIIINKKKKTNTNTTQPITLKKIIEHNNNNNISPSMSPTFQETSAIVPSFSLISNILQKPQEPSALVSINNNNCKKRKFSYDSNSDSDEYNSTCSFSPSSSPLSLSRVPSPSQEVVNSSPIASPQLTVPSTPLINSNYNNNNNSSNNSNNTNVLVAESLLFLLEQEVEKEIITQKENDLSARKIKQIQELEYFERTQQVLEYKKSQQDLEYIRLQQKQQELENWKIQLANYEKELLFKQQFINNLNFNVQQHQQQHIKINQQPQQSQQLNNNSSSSNNNKSNSMSFFNLLNSLAEESCTLSS